MTLAPGTRLLHIGPHKTGTTTLQAAFHENRTALAEQGVRYAGATRHSMDAAMAISSGSQLATVGLDKMAVWQQLRAEVLGPDARVSVVSSEFYSDAPRDRIGIILDELGREDTHVVVTLRPLVRILPSQWQQYMQNGPPIGYDPRMGYEQWLEAMLVGPVGGRVTTPSFWRRHRHDRLVRAWAEEAGRDRLTVVVVDENDKTMLLRSFEGLLGLTPGVLKAPQEPANRSLTVPELELLRAFNASYAAAGLSSSDYTYLVRFGAARFLQQRSPGPEEARLLTPGWAVKRAAEIGAGMAASIRESGVRVIGDLEVLSDESLASGVGENPSNVAVPAHVTARFTAGLIERLDRLPAAEVPAGRNAGKAEVCVRQNKVLRRWAGGSPAWERLGVLQSELQDVRRVQDLNRVELLRAVSRCALRRVRLDQRGA